MHDGDKGDVRDDLTRNAILPEYVEGISDGAMCVACPHQGTISLVEEDSGLPLQIHLAPSYLAAALHGTTHK